MASSDVLRDLAEKIDAGVWRDGERLPAERVLAAEYGLARNTLRRALAELEATGRLVRHVGRGTFIKAPPAASEPARRLREASPEHVMEAFLLVEPEAAALATARATLAELKEIERICRESVAAKGMAQFELWDERLHLAIFRAARNHILFEWFRALEATRNQPTWHKLKQRSLTAAQRAVYERQHGALVIALLERDAVSARRIAHQHVLSMRDGLFGGGDGQPP